MARFAGDVAGVFSGDGEAGIGAKMDFHIVGPVCCGLGLKDLCRITASGRGGESAITHEVLCMFKTARIKRLALNLPAMAERLAKMALASCGKLHGGWRRRDKARR